MGGLKLRPHVWKAVSPEFQAKNGTSLGREVTVNFVTAGTAVKTAPVAPNSDTAEKPAPEAPVAPSSETAKPEEAAITNPAVEKGEVKNAEPAAAASEQKPAVEEQKTPGVKDTAVTEDKSKQATEKEVKNEEKTPVKENSQDEQKPNRTYAIIAGLVLVAVAGYVQARKRKHK